MTVIRLHRFGHDDVVTCGPVVRLGRGQSCDVRINSPFASRHHCDLFVDECGASILDCKSRNGTFVNGDRISFVERLRSGDWLLIGREVIEILIETGDDVQRLRDVYPEELAATA